jgi:hypothetical protein
LRHPYNLYDGRERPYKYGKIRLTTGRPATVITARNARGTVYGTVHTAHKTSNLIHQTCGCDRAIYVSSTIKIYEKDWQQISSVHPVDVAFCRSPGSNAPAASNEATVRKFPSMVYRCGSLCKGPLTCYFFRSPLSCRLDINKTGTLC